MTTTTRSGITPQLGQYTLHRKVAPQPSPTACLASYEVWLVTDRDGQLKVLKRLQQDSDRRWDPRARDKAITYLRLEGERLAQFDGHPNIIRLAYQGGNPPFLVTDWVDQLPTPQQLGNWTSCAAARIGRDVCSGLKTIHQEGWVHRDIKPGNIGFNVTGGAGVLMDFSLVWPLGSRPEEDSGSSRRRIVGTLPYLAPEQLEGNELTAATDVFGLGVTLFQLLTGRLPFTFDPLAAITSGVHNLHDEPSWSGDLPPGHAFRSLLEGMLAKDPAVRPSVEEVHRELTALASPLEWFDPALL